MEPDHVEPRPRRVDAVVICLLVFGVHLPRHHRRDMVVSYLTVGIGVLAVAVALSISATAAGLGMGLFGVLSIIRLRSEELGQIETAYCFSALALGLLGGVGVRSRAGPRGPARRGPPRPGAAAQQVAPDDGRPRPRPHRRRGAPSRPVSAGSGRARASRTVGTAGGRAPRRGPGAVARAAGGPGFRGARRPDRAPRRGPGAPVPRRGGCRWWPARHDRPGPGPRRGS